MKTKKINNKLSFNKKTIAHLQLNQLGEIKGGNVYVSEADPDACGDDSHANCNSGDTICVACWHEVSKLIINTVCS